MSSSPTSTGGHDWHSPGYVREWIEGKEAQAGRLAEFERLADCIPHRREAPIRILDVGAGWGPLTIYLLDLFPAARATLLDYSDAMLDEARARLTGPADRVGYLVGDLNRPGAFAAAVDLAGAPFDAVVASCCFHNIEPAERVPGLYREIRAAVAPGGCFLNLDTVGTDGPILRDAFHRARVERLRRRRLRERGLMPSSEAAEAEVRARRDNHEPSSRSVAAHLEWLTAAGFDAVECFWRDGGTALIGGYVAGRRPSGLDLRPAS
jgi:tRNA (cmo5U34)-methyltransferase